MSKVTFQLGATRTLDGDLEIIENKIKLKFPYNHWLKEEVKALDGARFEPKDKSWVVSFNDRNVFALKYLTGKNPYQKFYQPLVEFNPSRNLYAHQIEMVRHILTKQQVLIAAEMGTGKTLAVIEALEYLDKSCILEGEVWYVSTKSALAGVMLEFKKWSSCVNPKYFTYEGMKKEIAEWGCARAPQVLIFDESSRIKTWSAQRTVAAFELAQGVRSDWGNKGYIVAMSGSPAPKSPIDWWSQCEVLQPGYLRESNPKKFSYRLGLWESMENAAGMKFPKLITWYDNENKCKICGKLKLDFKHMINDCVFVPSENEIAKLYRRMNGLVHVKFKKDCLDLPDKVYREIYVEPTAQTKRLQQMILNSAERAVTALTLCRELSDGFQYVTTAVEDGTCPDCAGTGKDCIFCAGTGIASKQIKETKELPCPKDQVLVDLLEDLSRVVIYAGFTASVNRCVKLCLANNWLVIKVDGSGWKFYNPGTFNPKTPVEMLELFQSGPKDVNIAFVGNPEAAGMGITLTASNTIIYYSNTFRAEDRIQSEDRIHRPGMDENKSPVIIDLIHLDTDKYVLDNLKMKKDLQAVTMGDLRSVVNKQGGYLDGTGR